MAIDTAAKRLAVLAVRRLPWRKRFMPRPDGVIDQPDRQQLGHTWRGFPTRFPFWIQGLVLGVTPSDVLTQIVFEVKWSFTVPQGSQGEFTEGVCNIPLALGLNDAQVRQTLRIRLAMILSDLTGQSYTVLDVRGCTV